MNSIIINKLSKIITVLALIFTLLISSTTFAQRRKATAPTKSKSTVAKNEAEEPAQACNGWRGTITYVQNLNEEKENREDGGYKKFTQITQVSAEINLAGGNSGPGKVSIAKRDIQDVEERRITNCGNWMNERTSTVISKHLVQSDETGSASGNVPVSVSIYNGNYSFDIHMPPVRGKTVLKGQNSQKGYCDPKLDGEQITPPVENLKQFDALRFRVEGKIDPQKPNVLSGTLKFDPNITINWHLTRAAGDCDDGDLALADLKLEQHVFPNKTAWEQVGANAVDGNQVKITAMVTNSSKKSKTGTVTIRENKSGTILGTKSVSVAGGGESPVELLWDTNGYAWTDDGRKASDREIEAIVGTDSLRQEITVVPKPVILVHGLWSNAEAWSNYQGFLDQFNDEWKSFAVGADPAHGKMNTGVMGKWTQSNSIFQNAQELGKQIKYTQTSMNAWHVDLVAHSMGGLISRFFIHSFMPTDSPDGKPYVTHLVMLGTPNEGSPCADLADSALDYFGKPVESLRQLKPDVVADFNRQITNRKGVRFSILVGTPVTATCQAEIPGDGVVSMPSAMWQVKDRGFAYRIHTELTGREDFVMFVKPRLALGPKKAAAVAAADLKNGKSDYARAFDPINENWLASTNPLPFLQNFVVSPLQTNGGAKVLSSKNIRVKAGETAEVPVNFAASAKSGATFLASPNLTVSLIDTNGEAIEKIEAGSAEAVAAFKTFYANGKSGNYVLRFENKGETDETAFASVWTNSNPLALEFVEIQKQTDGSVKMQATLTSNGSLVKGAVVAVKINNQATEIVLVDDGKHGDGAAGDGVYGATTEKLAAGEHFIETRATSNGSQATATTLLTIGEANK